LLLNIGKEKTIMNEKIEFIGVIKEIRAKSLVSLDKSYRILLETENPNILDAGRWGGDETVSVIICRNLKSQ
jgi:hypothetical protein